MVLLVVGSIVAVAAVVLIVLALAGMYRDYRVRIAHGVPDVDFFRMGSVPVLGLLMTLLLIGLGLVYLSR
jgi:hypothetical protein